MSSVTYRPGDVVVVNKKMPPEEDIPRSFQFGMNYKTRPVRRRTAGHWGLTIVFYILFYAFLAAFFTTLMVIFYQTLDEHKPKYTGSESLVWSPGLGLRPRLFFTENRRPYLIYHPEGHVARNYAHSLRFFISQYEEPPSSYNIIDCSSTDKGLDQVCLFDASNLNPSCTYENKYGYDSNSPCILLKINKRFDWVPSPILDTYILPEGLQRHINALENPQELMQQNVWVWCESNDVELEQLSPGIPIVYFPYTNQEGYLSPFTFVRALNLSANNKTTIECRLWAYDVDHSSDTQTGAVFINIRVELPWDN